MRPRFDLGYEKREFEKWKKRQYTWVDKPIEKMMFRAWCARSMLKKGKDSH